MKEVINRSRDTLHVSEVDSDMFYGFVRDNDKGFISREKFAEGNFIPFSIRELTNGNSWSGYRSDSLKEVTLNLIDKGFTVYQFVTAQELFTWLAK